MVLGSLLTLMSSAELAEVGYSLYIVFQYESISNKFVVEVTCILFKEAI